MFEIRIIRRSGVTETHYSDAPVRAGDRFSVDGCKAVVLERVRASSPRAVAAFVCVEVPAPAARWAA